MLEIWYTRVLISKQIRQIEAKKYLIIQKDWELSLFCIKPSKAYRIKWLCLRVFKEKIKDIKSLMFFKPITHGGYIPLWVHRRRDLPVDFPPSWMVKYCTVGLVLDEMWDWRKSWRMKETLRLPPGYSWHRW